MKDIAPSKLQTNNIHVTCTGHSGWMNQEAKKSYEAERERIARELKKEGFQPHSKHPDLFIKGKNYFARIHNINDWRITSTAYSEPYPNSKREGYYFRDLTYKGYRFHTKEAWLSRWVVA